MKLFVYLKPNPKVQRQHSHNSPLIPRRNDYEPMTRVTIQRQQRVSEQSPTKTSTERLCKNFSFSSESSPQQQQQQQQQQQMLEPPQFPSAINRPITLDLSKAVASASASYSYLKQNDSIGLSTTSTNEDDFLAIVDQPQAIQTTQPPVKLTTAGASKDTSFSLSSSSSPMTTSPRLLPRQPSNASSSSASASTRPFLTPANKLKSQSSDTSS